MMVLKCKMYVLLVYDIKEERVAKVLKVCRQYLYRIQNSVFEGEITDPNLRELKFKLKKIINLDLDSVFIFKMRTKDVFKKEIVGIEEFPIENIF